MSGQKLASLEIYTQLDYFLLYLSEHPEIMYWGRLNISHPLTSMLCLRYDVSFQSSYYNLGGSGQCCVPVYVG